MIVFNAIGTDTQSRLSGHDVDSDFVLVTDQPDIAALSAKAYKESKRKIMYLIILFLMIRISKKISLVSQQSIMILSIRFLKILKIFKPVRRHLIILLLLFFIILMY